MASKSSIEAGRGHVSLSVDSTALERGLQMASAKIQTFGRGIAVAGASIAATAGAIVAPFLYGLSVFTSWGEEMREAMRETGIGFEQLDYLGDALHASMENLIPAVAKVSALLVDAASGSAQANAALATLGLTIAELSDMSSGDRFQALAEALGNIADANVRIALTRQIFGKQGLLLNFEGGAAGMRERAARRDFIEGTPSEADQRNAAATGRLFKEMKDAIAAVWREIGSAAAPAMRELYAAVINIVVRVREFVNENRALLSLVFRVAVVVIGLGTAIGVVGATITTFGASLGVITPGLVVLGKVLAVVVGFFGWWLVPIAAVTAGIVYLANFTDVLTDAWDAFTEVAQSVWEALSEFFSSDAMQASLGAVTLAFVAIAAAGYGLYELFDFLYGIIDLTEIWGAVFQAVVDDWNAATEMFERLFDLVIENLEAIKLFAATTMENVMRGFSSFGHILEWAFEKVGYGIDVVSDAFNWMFRMVSAGVDVVVSWVQPIVSFLAEIGNRVSSAMAQTVSGFTSMFSGLLSTAGQTWQGIKDAFAVGEWTLIWDIVKASAVLAWAQIVAFIEPTFYVWKDTLTDVFTEVWDTLKQLFASGWAYVTAGFWQLGASILDSFAPVMQAITLMLQGLSIIDPTGPAAAALAFLATLPSAADMRQAGVDALAGGGPAVQALREEANVNWLLAQDLRRQRDEALAEGNLAAVAAAQDELDTLTDYARFLREYDEAMLGLGGGVIGGEGIGVAEKLSSIGSFSAQAAFGFLGASQRGETLAERTAREQRERLHADNLAAQALIQNLINVAGQVFG